MLKQNILLIDDDFSISCVISARLDKVDGHTVRVATNGKDGLVQAEKWKPDLILLDWKMPDISGMEVLEALKKSAVTKRIPVYMLTAMGTMDNIETALSAGAVDYVTKPINLEQLSSKAQRVGVTA